jgi:large subunit ribosomal protein L7e
MSSTKGKKEMEIEKSKVHVPENVQKKTERDEKLRQQRDKLRSERKAKNANRRTLLVNKAKQYADEYAKQERDIIEAKRKARAEGGFYVPAEAKVALVIRIRGINKMHPDLQRILRLLRLRQLHNATLIRINKATIHMLRKVEPYITYGYPSRSLIQHLVYKRGYARINKQRIPITNNQIIEEHLGKYGIISIEDLVHELTTMGPHFKQANSFLWPFKLRSPRGGFRAKRKPFHSRGDWGNREELINDLVKGML